MRIKQSLMISSGFLLFILFPAAVVAQTVADSGYVPSVKNASGNSCNPVILFDAGHHNFHSVKESAFSVPENALCMMQFTAEQVGFGSPNARSNEQFALNVIHWLCAK